MSANTAQFKTHKFLNLETVRKSGVTVATPVWFVERDGKFYVRTVSDAGKVKRIRNNAQVLVAPCTRMGEVTGEWVSGQASIDETPEGIALVETLLRRKVGIAFAVFRRVDKIRDRRRGGRRVCVRVSFPH